MKVTCLAHSLPGEAGVAAQQLDDPPCVADSPVSEQEEQAGVTREQRLPQDPGERRQDVGPAHVGSDLLDVFARCGKRLLCLGKRVRLFIKPLLITFNPAH